MSVAETLQFCRSVVKNPRVFVCNGDQWSPKAKGYTVVNEQIPPFTEEELTVGVDKGKLIALNLSENLGYIEFDPCETLGSIAAAEKWVAENMWRLERLQTTVVKSPRSGLHIWFVVSSGILDFSVLTRWLEVVEESGIPPDVLHFRSVNASDYAILPPSRGYSWITRSAIKRFA